LLDRCRGVRLSVYVVKDEAAVPVLDFVHICFPGHQDQFPLAMEWAITKGSLDDLCPRFLAVADDFQAHATVHVLDVVEALVTRARGLQPPPLVIPAGVRVLLGPSPLSRRFAFDLQDQLTMFVDELNNLVHRHCHDYILLIRTTTHIDQYKTMTPSRREHLLVSLKSMEATRD
jgi:hypothetical protein